MPFPNEEKQKWTDSGTIGNRGTRLSSHQWPPNSVSAIDGPSPFVTQLRPISCDHRKCTGPLYSAAHDRRIGRCRPARAGPTVKGAMASSGETVTEGNSLCLQRDTFFPQMVDTLWLTPTKCKNFVTESRRPICCLKKRRLGGSDHRSANIKSRISDCCGSPQRRCTGKQSREVGGKILRRWGEGVWIEVVFEVVFESSWIFYIWDIWVHLKWLMNLLLQKGLVLATLWDSKGDIQTQSHCDNMDEQFSN